MEKLSVASLSKISKLSIKTVYRVFHGTASEKSVLKIKKSIYKLTGKIVDTKEIVKGRYSENSLIKSLCASVEKKPYSVSFSVTFDAPYSCVSFPGTADISLHL